LVSSCIAAISSNPIDTVYVTSSWPGGLIIDHTCIDLDSIPSEYIDAAQADVKIHYAHTSHGGQVTEGLSLIESDNATFDVSIASLSLPTDANALCMYDGNAPHTYITPDLYWQGASATAITQNTIDNNPSFTMSLWSWCTQVDGYDATGIQEYLDTMTALEAANPGLTFVYMTGNAQATGGSGYNRWINNEMIRQYCIDNDKVLFDFADLDAWSNGVQNTYTYDPGDGNVQVPSEHPDFIGNEAAHTTYSSCEQKGRAFWWLVATLAGWNAPIPTTSTGSSTTDTSTITNVGTSTTESTTDSFPMNDTLVFTGIAAVVLLVVFVVVRRYYG
jgi:hypothetical protein